MYILGVSCFYHDSSAAILKDGEIISEVPLPIAGKQSRENIKTLAAQMRRVRQDMRALHCFLEDPFYTIHFLTNAVTVVVMATVSVSSNNISAGASSTSSSC